MKQRIRTFIAVETDAAIRKAAKGLIDQLRQAGADVKWVDPENLHLTVKFLGDVDAGKIVQVCGAVQKAVADLAPFPLEIRGAGAFPSVLRPQTIWLGAGEGDDRMAELAERIETVLEPFRFRRETRRYRSHLTLGRLRREGANAGIGDLGRLLEQLADYEAGRMPVEELVVFSSELTRAGPVYEVMGRAALDGQ
jgi:2'-5' RNA ligase